MPLYEYRCATCDKVFEVIQKFSDAALDKCPDCGKSVEKLMSRTSFQLKGSGWYATDYKKSGSASSTSASAPSSTAPKENCGATPTGCAKPDCGTKSGGSDK